MRHRTALCAALAVLLALPWPALADPVRDVRVHFPPGSAGTDIAGHVEGREIIDYRVGVRAGQMMRVALGSRSTAMSFNVYEPGKKPGADAAFYIGATSGNTVEFRTAHAGDYIIRVFLVPAAARRGEGARYTLDVSVGGGEGHAAAAPRPSNDARAPGADFNATGTIPCARERGQPMGSCRFGVKREGHGDGAITVFWPGGGNRVIFFEDNTPMRYDESQADGGARMTVGHEADLYHVRIGHQRFEIPAMVMTGRGPATAAPAAAVPAHAAPPAGANPGDARVPGTRFHATGDVPCATTAGQQPRPCPFGVVRGRNGEATVEVTKPDGSKRSIFFRGGHAVGADGSQADGSAGWRFVSHNRDGVFLITFGPERYEIFEAVVFGG